MQFPNISQNNSPKKVFIIGMVWPESNSSAAGTRMLQLISFFQKEGLQVCFGSSAQKSEWQDDIENMGIDTFPLQLNDVSFDKLMTEINPDIVVFDRFVSEEQFGWRVAQACPNAMRILDTEDLHSLRLARQEAVKKNKPFEIDNMKKMDVCKREIASIFRCDLSIMISEVEIEILQKHFDVPQHLLFYLPLLTQEPTFEALSALPSFEEREDFVFIGNFWHEPNWDAVLFLKKEIAPQIRKKIPQAKIHIYGAYATDKVYQLTNKKEGFLVHGRAENANTVMQKAKVLLAPLRFGAGQKGKLLEAMYNGTPSITTTIGAEGMQKDGLWNGFVSDNVEEWGNLAQNLYNDKDTWQSAQKNGFDLINKMFLADTHLERLSNMISAVFQNLSTHRNNNFIGALLMHHSMQSTKFMSKWIELKGSLRS